MKKEAHMSDYSYTCSVLPSKVLKDGKPDFAKIDPLFLTMPDNRYWFVGREAGKAWGAGKKVRG